jgi:hypothetical protein
MEGFWARVETMAKSAKLVLPVHFEDYGGEPFERLVFAYHARTDRWRSLEWYGQTGSDLGRDIWGVRENDTPQGESVCIQCANRRRVTLPKVQRDIDKLVGAPSGKPDLFRLVAGGPVSATMRDHIKTHVKTKGITTADTWSGGEFEELLRARCESLLRRFVGGEEFPDAPDELRKFAVSVSAVDDQERLRLMARAFYRPAFSTPIQQESSLPAFKQAITDTIQVLNTGVWQTRDRKEIGRLPSRHEISDSAVKSKLHDVERSLVRLRAAFDDMLRKGELRPCGCNQPDCPVFHVSGRAAEKLTELRRAVLASFGEAYPGFQMPDSDSW